MIENMCVRKFSVWFARGGNLISRFGDPDCKTQAGRPRLGDPTTPNVGLIGRTFVFLGKFGDRVAGEEE
jgi:hypothetical protein